MNPTTLILTTVGAALLAFAGFNSYESMSFGSAETVVAFEAWSTEFNKAYTPSEKKFRFTVFAKELAKINEVNALNVGYKLGLNEFSDMTMEEKMTKLTGLIPHKPSEDSYVNLTEGGNPATVDWRTKGAVTDVKNQARCGSCWAFSATGALEGRLKIKDGSLPNLSEQQLVDCSTSYGNHGCRGGLMTNSFRYIKDHKITTQAKYPYEAKDRPCRYKKDGEYTDTGFSNIPRYNCAQLETAISEGPTSVALSASGDFFSYRSGIYNGSCSTRLNHGLTGVGYGEENGTQYWIIKNSWGGSWGEQGYLRLMKTTSQGAGKCGICMMNTVPTL